MVQQQTLETKEDPHSEESAELESKSKDSIEYSLLNFIDHLLSLQISYEVTSKGFVLEQKRLRNEFKNFIIKKAKEEDNDGKRIVVINPDAYNEFENLAQRLKSFKMAFDTFPQSYFISLLSCLDVHIVNCMKWVLFTKPEVLNGSGRSYVAKDILKDGSLEKIKEIIIEDELLDFSQKSYMEQFGELEKKHKIDLLCKFDCWPAFIEISARRNLIVHADGVINDQYLGICEKYKIPIDGKIKGDQLSIDNEYFNRAFEYIFQVGLVFGQELWRHFKPDGLAYADKNLNDSGVNFLRFDQIKLAQMVFEYGFKLSEVLNDENKKIFIINRAQAFKWGGNEKKCEEIIKGVDWSSSSLRFKLCCYVLLDDFTDAFQMMRKIGNNPMEIPAIDYRTWPVFRKIREEKEFQEIFTEIFNEPFAVQDPESLVVKKETESDNHSSGKEDISCG